MAAKKIPKNIPTKKLAQKLSRLVPNQSEISRRTGLAQSAISEASSGTRRLYLDQAFLIARAVNVPLDYLADDEVDDLPGYLALTEDDRLILDLYREARGKGHGRQFQREAFRIAERAMEASGGDRGLVGKAAGQVAGQIDGQIDLTMRPVAKKAKAEPKAKPKRPRNPGRPGKGSG